MNLKKIVLVMTILSFIFTSICYSSGNLVVKGGNYEGVILIKNEGVKLTKAEEKIYNPDWIPDKRVIEQLESKVDLFILYSFVTNIFTKEDERIPYRNLIFVWKNLKHYKRQYLGKVIHGKRVIRCSFVFFHQTDDHLGKQWKKNFISVMDGGPRIFYVDYDVKTQRLKDLFVNGI